MGLTSRGSVADATDLISQSIRRPIRWHNLLPYLLVAPVAVPIAVLEVRGR